MAANWDTLPGRLRWAIGRHPRRGRERGLRFFQRRMEEAGAPGYSLSTIQGYLRGEAEPSLAFLHAAATLLNVRVAWLAVGHGEPTEAAEAARVAAKDRPTEDLAAEAVFRAHVPWDFIGESGRAQVWKLWGVFIERDLHSPTPPTVDTAEDYDAIARRAAEQVGAAVMAPVQAASAELPLGLAAVESYVVNVCEALFHVMLVDVDDEED